MTNLPTKSMLAICVALLAGVIGAEVAARVAGYQPAGGSEEEIAQLIDLRPAPQPRFEVNDKNLWVAKPGASGVNADGFRHSALPSDNDKAPRIALFGGSVAWGENAVPFSNSTADILRDLGYFVYNFGIPGSPHWQWLEIARQELPEIKPDILLVLMSPSQDLEPVPRFTKEEPPYFETTGGLIPARDVSGAPLTFSESVAALRASAESADAGTGWLERRSAIVANFLSATDPTEDWDLTAAVDSLALLDALADELDAVFLFVLVPAPPSEGGARRINDRAESALSTFNPIMPDELIDEALFERGGLNSEGHGLLSRLIAHRLEQEGFLPAFESSGYSTKNRVAWNDFSAAVGLDDAQEQQIRQMLNRHKDQAAELFARQNANGDSPVKALAASLVEAARTGNEQDMSTYEQTLETVVDAETQRTYVRAYEAFQSETYAALTEILNEDQRILFNSLELGSLLDIETGHDPFADRVALAVTRNMGGLSLGAEVPAAQIQEKLPLNDVAAKLTLRPDQQDELRQVVADLKNGFAALLDRNTDAGQESPIQHMANLLQRIEPGEAQAALDTYMSENNDSQTGKAYTAAAMDLEMAARDQMSALLDAEQLKLVSTLPITAVMSIDIGTEPFADRLQAAFFKPEEVTAPAEDPNHITYLAAQLQLDEQQRTDVEATLNSLKHQISDLLFQAPEQGDPPGVLFARLQRDVVEDAAAQFLQYMDTTKAPGGEVSYSTRLKLLNEEALERLRLQLPPDKLEQLLTLAPQLQSIKTSTNPFDERVEATKEELAKQ